MSTIPQIKVKNIDHLGIVAGLIDEIGIVEIVNKKLGIDAREKISSGKVVKAILINGLGFVSRPLYLFSQFFEDKEIETLLGAGTDKNHINDDKIGDGNEADKAVFAKILKEFNKQINFSSIMVCDSALYSQENLQLMVEIKWITRVPMTIKKAQELVKNLEIKDRELEQGEEKATQKLQGYKWKEEIVTYGGIKQIWLVVESEKRKISDLMKLEKQIEKEKEKQEKFLKELEKEGFENPEQARYKLKGINKKLKLFKIEEIEIIKSLSKAQKTIYKIKGVGQPENQAIEIKKKEAGRFILATNLVEQEKLNSEEIITIYKNQQSCERGFRFLKDPLFFTDSFFVENPERIETMLFLMSLCLLVYNLGQRELRNNLKKAQTGIKNQLVN